MCRHIVISFIIMGVIGFSFLDQMIKQGSRVLFP